MGFALVIALVAACGGGSASLTSPTALGSGSGGSSISGLVLGAAPLTTASTGRFSTLDDHSLTVKVNGTDISSSVDGAGAFTLSNVPPGPVTLTFSGRGVDAAVTISKVAPNEDVKITVSVNGSSAHLESEEHHGHDSADGELSGAIADLNTAAATFKVGTQLVHVSAAAQIRRGDRTLTLSDLKNGNIVEVRGTLSGTTLDATDVKVEDGGDHD